MLPQVKLEFAKMTIRTKALEITARNRGKLDRQLTEIESEIINYTELLTRYTDDNSQNIIVTELESLNSLRNEIMCEQGVKLAQRAKTKWYNEGEGSNKYFLNMLKRRGQANEMSELTVDGHTIDTENGIRQAVTNFYSQLYNRNLRDLVEDDSFFQHMFSVDPADKYGIDAPIHVGELWEALKPTKATTPGPDGISNTYLKKLWDILGPLIAAAWSDTMARGELMPSHKTSLLRLIPKAGKDAKQLKNWRPITLSNCDHKLITRLYNKRLLKAIGKYISPTQTAYIKGRNIADNLRLVAEDVNATIVALDAQKAFDSVSHQYLAKVLTVVGLDSFVPIFKLLYKGLENDIIINGEIKKGFKVNNGVKQGDALSCTLFLLAIEPVIRNIENNNRIRPVRCARLNYTWPTTVAYADDITVVTHNEPDSVSQIFAEYERLTKASGLTLNADKTEKFDLNSGNVHRHGNIDIMYMGARYTLVSQPTIKINGIFLARDTEAMQQLNYDIMTDKMIRHFREWSKRSLSLLGKIQIIKTFGLSQYLYTLMVTDLSDEHWASINKLINKFLWNKNFNGPPAPHRIGKNKMHRSTLNGGFGMLCLKKVASAARLRRFAHHLEVQGHPVRELQLALGAGEHLKRTVNYQIDSVTCEALEELCNIQLSGYAAIPDSETEFDLILHNQLLGCAIRNLIRSSCKNSIESVELRRRGHFNSKLQGVLPDNQALRLLTRVCYREVRPHILKLAQFTAQLTVPPDEPNQPYLYDKIGHRWLKLTSLTSKQIRELSNREACLNETKLLTLDEAQARALFQKLSKVKSILNRTKLYRLIHGDVYCGSRAFRFGLIDSDRCICCFEEETIRHLLLECPYSREVWSWLGVNYGRPEDILDGGAHPGELEIRAELIAALVFRKKVVPPEVLISTTINGFAKGISAAKMTQQIAMSMVNRHQIAGQWFRR